MTADLPPQIPNTPTKPGYAAIEPYIPNPAVQCIQDPNSKCRQERPETESLGGHFAVSFSGTTASGTTQSMTQFVPWEYPNPSQLVQSDYEARQLEIKPELRLK